LYSPSCSFFHHSKCFLESHGNLSRHWRDKGIFVMVSRTQNKSSFEPWISGTPLDDAAWGFASEYERNKARGPHANLDVHYILMRRELLAMLLNGEVFAYGLRVGTPPSAGPEQISHHFFRDPKVDWGESSLVSGGHRCEQVRVSAEQAGGLGQETKAASSGEVGKQPSAASARKRMGRPPVGEQLRSLVRELQQADRLSGKSRKEQEAVVRQAAKKKHPDLFPREGQPSRTKILQALKAEQT
jgi:hypothetical protein